jgi:hypothetical protein
MYNRQLWFVLLKILPKYFPGRTEKTTELLVRIARNSGVPKWHIPNTTPPYYHSANLSTLLYTYLGLLFVHLVRVKVTVRRSSTATAMSPHISISSP